MLEVYWILLLPFTLITIILAQLDPSGEGSVKPNVLIKRIMLSILLVVTVPQLMATIQDVGNSIIRRIGDLAEFWDVLSKIGEVFSNTTVSWFKARESILYVLSLVSYIVAYVSVFSIEILAKFVWVVLYICSPLMCLAYVNQKTANITASLFKGLINVILWRLLWTILGALLLKLATAPQVGDWKSFFETIVINFCIAFCMLFVPAATRSLLSDGMSGAASKLSLIPAGLTYAAIKSKMGGKKGKGGKKKGGGNKRGGGRKSKPESEKKEGEPKSNESPAQSQETNGQENRQESGREISNRYSDEDAEQHYDSGSDEGFIEENFF